jgi:glutathione S-transferase
MRSAMIQVWGRTTSINTQKVLWTLGELGLEFERFDVGGAFGGLDTASYTSINPNRRIPTIRDGDLVLWESNVIVRYLAARYGGGSLWIAAPAERAAAERWMDWQHTTLLDPMRSVFVGLAQTPPGERDSAAIGAAAEALHRVWSRLDLHLRGRAFVAGPHLTMADIPAGAWCHRYHQIEVDRSGLDALTGWYTRLTTRPAYQNAVMGPPL